MDPGPGAPRVDDDPEARRGRARGGEEEVEEGGGGGSGGDRKEESPARVPRGGGGGAGWAGRELGGVDHGSERGNGDRMGLGLEEERKEGNGPI